MTFPVYARRERLADGLMHALGVPASVAAAIVVIVIAIQGEPALGAVSVIVYAAALVASFACSAAYNMNSRPGWKDLLRRLDHCAIFLLIAGTYTPFAVLKIGGAWGYGLLAAVWAIAILGIALRLFAPQQLSRVSIGLYLLQGWAVVVAIDPLMHAVSPGVLVLLLAGGVLYTAGVLFHVWERLPYQNAIWHAFVLVATGCHYAAVVGAVQA